MSSTEDFIKWGWFHCSQTNCFSIQDIIHIATKLRNRLLSPGIVLPLGKYLISSSHLTYLIQNVSKDKHCVTASDINPKDRQNFGSMEKIMQPNVLTQLKKNVPDSNGTVLYLSLCDSIVSAFRDAHLKPLDRIYKMWYAVFFLRGWRLHIQKSKDYTLRNNFITSNAYTCIELNAHSMVELIVYLRKINKPEWFLPILMSSQPCEEFFRKVRSFTSTYSTQVNFSLLEIIQRIMKIHLQGEIILNNKQNIHFPRLNTNSKSELVFDLPDSNDIFNEIEKARKDAIDALRSVEIIIETDEQAKEVVLNTTKVTKKSLTKIIITEKELNATGVSNDDDLYDDEETTNIGEELEHDDAPDEDFSEDMQTISSLTGELMFRDYGDGTDYLQLSPDIPLTIVEDSTKKKKVVRKSTVLWLLVTNPERISSDRLQRVKISEICSRAALVKPIPTVATQYHFFRRQEEVTIGEWCLFHVDEDLVMALIVGIKYLTGKSIRETKYSKQSVQIKIPAGTTPRGIGVLGTWHKLKQSLKNPCMFSEFEEDDTTDTTSSTTFHEFLDIRNYVGTIEKPIFSNGRIYLKSFPLSTVLEIKSYLKKGK